MPPADHSLSFLKMTFSLPAWLRRPSSVGLLLVALLLQIVLVFRALGALLTEPGQHQLVSGYDGLKNYFTFQAYLQQPASAGFAWFGMMNYPFGEYIFYTDNTPLLAIAVRLWSQYVHDVTPYGTDIYHWLLLLGFLASTALLVLILRRLLHYWGLALVFSVALPWLSPQVGRLLMGHFNLSYSWVVLLAIWGLLRIYDRAQAGQPISKTVAGLVVAFTLISFLHLYYLPLLGLLTGSFFAAWLLPKMRWRAQPRLTLAGIALSGLPLILSVLIVRMVDRYYSLRLADVTGFNYPAWKLQVSALLQQYSYETIHFIIEPTAYVTQESQAYLGAFALFGLVALGVAWLFFRLATKRWWQAWAQTSEQKFLALLGIAALVGLFGSIGTVYDLFDGQYRITNYLSPFYYLHKLTDRASQFRTVARFCWPFFWFVNLFVLVGLDYWLRTSRQAVRWWLAIGLMLLAYLDTRDTLKFYRHSLLPNTLTNSSFQPEINPLVSSVRPEEYQAILPVPFYHVGSENIDLTLDDDDAHSRHTYQLALRTNLPLMATKMSRTPPEHARLLRTIFDAAGPAPELRKQLVANGKPVLVLFDKSYYDGSNDLAGRQTNSYARQLIEAGAVFPTNQHLTLLAESGKLQLYRWDVR
jgi:hypothetical protein